MGLLAGSGHANCSVNWGRKMGVISANLPLLKLHSASLHASPGRVLMEAAAPPELQAVVELVLSSTAHLHV